MACRILYTVGSFFPAQNGGPDLSLYTMTQELSQCADVEITVVTHLRGISEAVRRQYGIVSGRPIMLGRVRVFYFPEYLAVIRFWRLLWWVLWHIREFDVVHITSFFAGNSVGTRVIAKLFGKPVVVSPRGELESAALGHRGGWKRLFFYGLLRVYAGVSFHVTSVSEKASCERYFPGAVVFLLPNLVAFSGEVSRVPFCEKRGVLYLGRLHPHKGIDRLIAAYSELPGAIREVHPLYLAGSGISYEKTLKEQVRRLRMDDQVLFLGAVSGEKKGRLLADSLMLVLPSKSENFGMVIVEAIEAFTYVITSIYTPWERLEAQGLGRWVDNTPVALLEAMTGVFLLDEAAYSSVVLGADAYIRSEFDVTKEIARFGQMYDQVCRCACD